MSGVKIEGFYIATGTATRPGGQHAGNPPRGIRVTHEATGLVAECSWARSDHKNKQIAMVMLEYGLAEIGVSVDDQT